jgi:hypothetical protein
MLIIFGIFFSIIFLLTILKEIKKFDFIWNRVPKFMQFIPNWSFFAPTPNMFDYHLLYRVISNNGKVQEWTQVYSVKDKRPMRCFLWHPEKIFAKAFLDISLDLLNFSNKINDRKQICVSLPYLQLLNYLDPLPEERSSIQFMILTNSKVYDYDMFFLSEVHPLSRR